jgi:uncharacterized protein YeaO (DUF488 family)
VAGRTDHPGALAHLEALGRQGKLTLVTATKDVALSHARVLAARLAGDRNAE